MAEATTGVAVVAGLFGWKRVREACEKVHARARRAGPARGSDSARNSSLVHVAVNATRDAGLPQTGVRCLGGNEFPPADDQCKY